MTSIPEENTLGVVVGSKNRRREADATRRVIRAATPRRSSLGIGFIGIGAAVVVGLRAIYGFVWFLGLWEVYPNPYPALAAWLVLIVTLVATFVASRVIGELPTWIFALFLVGLAVAVALDLYAVWPLHDIGRTTTAAVTAGMGLLVVLTLRGTVEILVSAGVLGAALATAMILGHRVELRDRCRADHHVGVRRAARGDWCSDRLGLPPARSG